MADVFISYSQKDRDIARGLAGFLTENGLAVWWDHDLVGGESYRSRIKEELAKAKAAIVIWSPNSVESSWVIEEADEARECRKLVATRTDGFDFRAIPLGFRSLQTDPITASDQILKALTRLGVSASPTPAPPRPERSSEPRADAPDTADKIALEHWEYVKESRDPAEFERFIREFPTSKLAPLAQIQLGRLATEAWQNLLGSENIPALEQFVRSFPGDARAADARRRLDVLRARSEEAESWARVRTGSDIEAVRSHIARFPGGANAAAARARLQALERERDAEDNWQATAGATEPGPFEQFLAAYPDSAHAGQARLRLEEIHRAREEADWRAVRNERHPAPFLRFLKSHPKGQHAAEAMQSIAALPALIEQDAWSEVKDSGQPSALQGYLTAFPGGRNVKAARARLRTLGGAQVRQPNPASAAPWSLEVGEVPQPNPAGATPAAIASAATTPSPGADALAAKPARSKRVLFWLAIGLMLLFALGPTGDALLLMSSSYGASGVSGNLAMAGFFAGLAAFTLWIVGPRLYPSPAGSQAKRALLFHAIGALGILLGMSLVQAVGEARYGAFNQGNYPYTYAYNVQRGLFGLYPSLAFLVLLAAAVSLRAKKWLWLRYGYYALVFVIGFVSVIASFDYFSFGRLSNYWVTTALLFYGGMALLLLSCGAIVRRLVRWRRGRSAAAPRPP